MGARTSPKKSNQDLRGGGEKLFIGESKHVAWARFGDSLNLGRKASPHQKKRLRILHNPSGSRNKAQQEADKTGANLCAMCINGHRIKTCSD